MTVKRFASVLLTFSSSYGRPTRADSEFVGDARHAMLLCSEAYKFFDDKRLVFTLETSQVSSSTATLVVHVFLLSATTEMICLYHNLSLQSLTRISVEYLFARFA